jgi:hypothetical protein
MRSIEGHTYAQIRGGRVHAIFDAAQLPEWNEHDIEVIDVTGLDPAPAVGWYVEAGQLSATPIALADQRAEIDRQLQTAVSADIEFGGHWWQADERSRSLLASTATYVAAGGVLPEGFAWRDRDNVNVPMSSGMVLALHRAIVERNYAAHAAAFAAKDALEAQ